MNFKNWFLLSETTTITQTIKQIKSSNNKEDIQNFETTAPFVQEQLDLLPPQINQNLKTIYKNYFTYQLIKDKGLRSHSPITATRSTITREINNVKDYLIANKDDNKLKSKLNTITFTLELLNNESNEWHEQLKLKQATPAREAETFINLDHLGPQWKNWRWVNLDRGYCKSEADSAGHCGNAANKPNDNILSLRDPNNIAILTFIENKGFLTEMKGRHNEKPSPKYHQPIIELLKNDKILTIVGGGYKPENNFSLNDLPNKEDILKIKPNLDVKNYIINAPSDEQKTKLLSDIIDVQIHMDENENFIVYEYDNTEDFINHIKEYTNSNIKRNLNTKFLDEIINGNPYIEVNDDDTKEAIKSIYPQTFENIKKYASKQDINLETPEDILEHEEILQIISESIKLTFEQSYLTQYWNHFKHSFEDKNDVLTVKIENFDTIKIILNKSRISEIEHIDELMQDLNFTYYPPDIYPDLDDETLNQYINDSI